MDSQKKMSFIANVETYEAEKEVMGHIVEVRIPFVFIPKEVRESLDLKTGESVEFSIKLKEAKE